MNPAHHRYIELYHKLQHFTPRNNLFGQTTEYRALHWIWVNPSWQLLKISDKRTSSQYIYVSFNSFQKTDDNN